jgi:hypothetical protein
MDNSNRPTDNKRPAEVVRLAGSGKELLPHLTLRDLPPPGTRRWVMRRKAEVVAAVRNGILTLEQACERYTLSVEEFLSWQELIDRHGVRALRATRVKDYRTSISEPRRDDDRPDSRPHRTG